MVKAGATRTRTAELLIVVAVVALVAAYELTSQPRATSSTGLTSQLSTTPSTGGSSQGHSSSSSAPSSSAQSSSLESSLSSNTSTTSTSVTPHISHVVVILMENEEYGSVIGSASAPYENGLASSYALAANYTGVAHPSLPNYLALIAGSTFGVNSDCLPAQCSLPSSATTITSLLDSHNLSWREYAESMPVNCSQTNSADGLYFPKHDPFVYFASITGNNGTGDTSAYCDSHVVPMGQLYLDLQSGNLPNYSFVTPNICHDAHSCSLSTGDEWLSGVVPKIINSSSFATTALFIVYDEGSGSDTTGGGGHVPCILVSPLAKAGYVSHSEYSHYSLLATVEAIFNLGNLGRDDSSATPMWDLFLPSARN